MYFMIIFRIPKEHSILITSRCDEGAAIVKWYRKDFSPCGQSTLNASCFRPDSFESFPLPA